MASLAVKFRYLTGLKRRIFTGATALRKLGQLRGGIRKTWTQTPMIPGRAEDGCPCFTATVALDDSGVGTAFRWGVTVDGPQGANVWGIPTEVNDMNSAERYREFTLTSDAAPRSEDFYLTYARRLGARKYFTDGATDARPPFLGVGAEREGGRGRLRLAEDGLHRRRRRRDRSAAAPDPAVPRELTGSGSARSSPGSTATTAGPTCIGSPTRRARPFTAPTCSRAIKSAEGVSTRKAAITPATPSTLDGTKGCSLVRGLDSRRPGLREPGRRAPAGIPILGRASSRPGSPVPSLRSTT